MLDFSKVHIPSEASHLKKKKKKNLNADSKVLIFLQKLLLVSFPGLLNLYRLVVLLIKS